MGGPFTLHFVSPIQNNITMQDRILGVLLVRHLVVSKEYEEGIGDYTYFFIFFCSSSQMARFIRDSPARILDAWTRYKKRAR